MQAIGYDTKETRSKVVPQKSTLISQIDIAHIASHLPPSILLLNTSLSLRGHISIRPHPQVLTSVSTFWPVASSIHLRVATLVLLRNRARALIPVFVPKSTRRVKGRTSLFITDRDSAYVGHWSSKCSGVCDGAPHWQRSMSNDGRCLRYEPK